MMLVGNCPLVLGGGGVVFSQRVLLVESFFSIERGSLMMLVENCPLVLGGRRSGLFSKSVIDGILLLY